MIPISFRAYVLAIPLCAIGSQVLALNGAVPAIQGDLSRTLLGNGTGVIVGIVDSGIDDLHPTLAGNDSLANPRLVAEANFVTTEPGNTGDDVYGHGTWIASAALGSDAFYTGMASDARYVNARVLDSDNGFPDDTPIKNGVGFAIEQGADVLNLSLNFFLPENNGQSQLDLMVDWAAFERGISCAVCAGNIVGGDGSPSVHGPGSAYNGITVGRTDATYSRVHFDSAEAFTEDGRMKPDVVAPGTSLTLANHNWEGAEPDWVLDDGGCSFATPLVAGLIAQQIEAGKMHGLSTDPLVIKATMMNSATKVLDKQNDPWEPYAVDLGGGVYSALQPLDIDSGAGQVNGLRLAQQYLAGQMAPGAVDAVGWDLSSISSGAFVDYLIDPLLLSGSTLTATLSWHRHVGRTDDGNGIVDAGDVFFELVDLSDLDLFVFRDGVLVAESISSLDNVEHLSLQLDRTARYTLRVQGVSVTSDSEAFALAWYGTAVPEPGTIALALLAAIAIVARKACPTRKLRIG